MEKTFLEITHAWIYARGEGGGRSGPPLEISNLSNSPGKIPENSPFPFWKQSYSSNPRIHPPPPPPGEIYIRWHQFSWIL